MTRQEWAEIVARLNATFPHQQMEPMTAAEFYTDLADYPAERVWRAVRRIRTESGRQFQPSLGELIEAMLANAHDRKAASDRLAIEARDPDSPGVPPPADYKAARERFLAGSRIPPDQHPPGRSRDQQLAELKASMDDEAVGQ